MEWKEAVEKSEKAAKLISSGFNVAHSGNNYPLPGVGVGITRKTGESKLVFHLAYGAQRSTVEDIIATLDKKTPAEVRVVGVAHTLPFSADTRNADLKSNYTERLRPLNIGCFISRQDSFNGGTLGCFVRKRDDSSDFFILSCAHVLTNLGEGQTGDVIVQPARNDLAKTPEDNIAILSEFTPLIPKGKLGTKQLTVTSKANNKTPLDAAIAKLTCEKTLQNQGMLDELSFRNYYKREDLTRIFFESEEEVQVFKIGSNTQKTSGFIKEIKYALPSLMYVDDKLQNSLCCRYEDVIVIETQPSEATFSEHGDSGSIIYDKAGIAIGLLIGGSSDQTLTYALPIETVLNRLDIELI
ncbi:MAG: hypothetical protein AAGA80_07560 [Cyanobacteria bacterium P01_F01_bin.143]